MRSARKRTRETFGRPGAAMLALAALASLAGAANYANVIDSRPTFDALTMAEEFRPDLLRTGKYLAPAVEGDLLPVCYQNVNVYPRHLEFMAFEFPERFPAFTPEEYMAIVERRATRQYWAGALFEIEGGKFGITVFTDVSKTTELPTRDEVTALIAKLAPTFLLGPLCYIPDSDAARENARTWEDPPFCIYYLSGDGDVVYEPYSLATGYGRIRLMTAREAEEASSAGTLSWQDILILDAVPAFLEAVIAGVITGARQGELSHLNVRASRRGTPNAYVKDPHAAFAAFEGKLVKLVVGPLAYEPPVEVPEAEAQAWWDAHRPTIEPPPPVDTDWSEMTNTLAMTGEPVTLLSRFGAKAANLSLLYRCLPEQYQVPSFAIPFKYYAEFMARNIILDRRVSPPRAMTCQAYVNSLLADAKFASDSVYRATLLNGLVRELRDYMVADPAVVAEVAAQAEKVYGSTRVMLRSRSSSNMEDDIAFSGAGLYDSYSICPADSLDADDDGPSACNPDKDGEREIERGLVQVWASLWNMRAFEERSYYQLPHDEAAMGILVTPAFPDEAANGVAFTGNPFDPFDRRYLINVQYGDASVVLPDPTVTPEKDILALEDGEVTAIVRARPSSLMPPGTYVLTDAQLKELGRACAIASDCFHVDPGPYDPSRVILDIEFKFTRDGSLKIKQVRPYLIPEGLVNAAYTFRIVIPDGTEAAGTFLHQRTLDIEQERHAWARFRPGTHEIVMRGPTATGDLIERLWLFAPDGETAPTAAGEFTLTMSQSAGQPPYLELVYRHRFAATDGVYAVTIKLLRFQAGQTPADIVFDERYLSNTPDFAGVSTTIGGLWMQAVPVDDPDNHMRKFRFGSTTYAAIPRYRVEIQAQDERIELDYRLKRLILANGPAQLMGARVVLAEGTADVGDYWHLVYAADWHNTDQRFRVVLDPPLGDVHAVDIAEPYRDITPARVALRGPNMEVLRMLAVDSYRETLIGDPNQAPFRRGDAAPDGRLTISDAVAILKHVTGRDPSPPCAKALDVNDDGRLDIADAVRLLGYLFAGGMPPEAPFAACGLDQTVLGDPLTCGAYAPCAR
ncbi:MAG TPA: hypothetical protein DCM87_22530 [Planctomycetes bacterium]|nr:hypothetical protein [Planctomycetota bacterium]